MPLSALAMRATREEKRDNYRWAEEALVARGLPIGAVVRELVQRRRFSDSQARRYCYAVRKKYASHASEDLPSVDELLSLLLSKAVDAVAGEEPDHKAAAKYYELHARLRGWLDKRSTVQVQVSGSVAHVDMTDWSDEELALHAQLADARARRLAAGEREVIDTTAVHDGDVVSSGK